MTDIAALTDTVDTQAISSFETVLRLVNTHSTTIAVLILVVDILVVAGCILAIVMRRSTNRQVLEIEAKSQNHAGGRATPEQAGGAPDDSDALQQHAASGQHGAASARSRTAAVASLRASIGPAAHSGRKSPVADRFSRSWSPPSRALAQRWTAGWNAFTFNYVH